MPMSELAQRAQLPASTIRYYIKKGLVPPGVKTGRTRAYYTDVHLQALEAVNRALVEESRTLDTIREDLGSSLSSPTPDASGIEPDRERQILSTATELFLRQGYTQTTVGDIARQARMSKATVYQRFATKREIFIACAELVFRNMYADDWDRIRQETGMAARLRARSRAFMKSYPQWISMMNLVRGLAVGDSPEIAGLLDKTLTQITKPLSREIGILQEQEQFRTDVDPALAAFIMLGISEAGGQLVQQGQCSAEDITAFTELALTARNTRH